MRSSQYSEEQIIGILKEVSAGRSVREVIRHYGIAESTFYRWRERLTGVEVREARRLAQLEVENRRLKQMVAELTLDKEALAAVIAKNGLRR
ncbi:MAG: transposase [Candidatus Binataceae bacterium]